MKGPPRTRLLPGVSGGLRVTARKQADLLQKGLWRGLAWQGSYHEIGGKASLMLPQSPAIHINMLPLCIVSFFLNGVIVTLSSSLPFAHCQCHKGGLSRPVPKKQFIDPVMLLTGKKSVLMFVCSKKHIGS